jgi:hypothetical protein
LPPGGLIPPQVSKKDYGRPLLSRQEEHKLYDALMKTNHLTLLVWMSTGNLEQIGPARIVTYSRNAHARNFTLGQVRDTLTFRLRTPASGDNGTDPHSTPDPFFPRTARRSWQPCTMGASPGYTLMASRSHKQTWEREDRIYLREPSDGCQDSYRLAKSNWEEPRLF